MAAGDHAFTWNGKDLTGAQLPNGGTYTLKVTATDATGAALAATNYVQGVVTGVTQANGATSITVNGGAGGLVEGRHRRSSPRPRRRPHPTTPATGS